MHLAEFQKIKTNSVKNRNKVAKIFRQIAESRNIADIRGQNWKIGYFWRFPKMCKEKPALATLPLDLVAVMVAVKLWRERSLCRPQNGPAYRNEYCRAKKSHKPRNAAMLAVVEFPRCSASCEGHDGRPRNQRIITWLLSGLPARGGRGSRGWRLSETSDSCGLTRVCSAAAEADVIVVISGTSPDQQLSKILQLNDQD